MQSVLYLALFGSLVAGQTINCNSFGIPDGYQGFDKWRASTKDCAEATNVLEAGFGGTVPQAGSGCVSLATSGNCDISVCDSQDVRAPISYESVWAAARVIHARHKANGNVAGYVSLDDYRDAGGSVRTYVKVARKDTPDPGNKRRSLFGRRSALDEIVDEDAGSPPPSTEDSSIEPRTGRQWSNRDRRNIPNTNGLYANIRTGWGGREQVDETQMQNGMENLLRDWNSAQGSPSTIRPAAYMAPGNTMIEFEWAAHNNHNVDAIAPNERSAILYWAIRERQEQGDHWDNFAIQIRRDNESLGHLIIRVFWAGLNDALANVCG